MKNFKRIVLLTCIGSWQAIRSNLSASFVVLFLVFNIVLAGTPVTTKSAILLLSLAVMLVLLICRNDWLWLQRFYRSWLCFSRHSWDENAHSLAICSLLTFFLSLFLSNIGLVWPARWLLLGFIIFGLLSALILLAALMINQDQRLKKAGFALSLVVPVIYAITSSYAASDYLVMSGINLADSPILSRGIGALYFSVWCAVLIYPAASIIYLIVMNKSQLRMMVTLTAMFFVLVFATQALTQWFVNMLVEVQDYAINREWQTSYWCAGGEHSEPQERYFPISYGSWSVHYSGREKQWGFESLHCETGADGKAKPIRSKMEGPHKMPQWFHDIAPEK